MATTHVLTRQKLIEIAGTLPPAPRVFAELHGLLMDVNTDIDRITDLIKRDASLAAQMLRVSNSVVFRGEQRAGSVEDAVSRIGFKEVYRVVGLVAAQRLAERALMHYEVSAERLREHMVETAFVCEALADACNLDSRVAYTAGLMRPIGILILDRVADLLKVEDGYDHARDGSYLSWEGRHFGMGSCEVSGLILADWAFPEPMVAAIRDQYLNFENATRNRMACLLNLACGVVAGDGRALEGETKYWQITDEKLQALGLSQAAFGQASKKALKAYNAYRLGIPVERRNEQDVESAPLAQAPVAAPAPRESAPTPPVAVAPTPAERPDALVEAPAREPAPPFAQWSMTRRLLLVLASGAVTGVLAVAVASAFMSDPFAVYGSAPLPAAGLLDSALTCLGDFILASFAAVVRGRFVVPCALVCALYLYTRRHDGGEPRTEP